MEIRFKTNLDAYQTNCFPENLTEVPRKGENILVNSIFIDYFKKKKLPVILEVYNVTWCEDGVVCELSYRKIDLENARLNGINLF